MRLYEKKEVNIMAIIVTTLLLVAFVIMIGSCLALIIKTKNSNLLNKHQYVREHIDVFGISDKECEDCNKDIYTVPHENIGF